MPRDPAALPRDVAAELLRMSATGAGMASDLHALDIWQVADLVAAGPPLRHERLCRLSTGASPLRALHLPLCRVFRAANGTRP